MVDGIMLVIVMMDGTVLEDKYVDVGEIVGGRVMVIPDIEIVEKIRQLMAELVVMEVMVVMEEDIITVGPPH
jgi:hypothetical protein